MEHHTAAARDETRQPSAHDLDVLSRQLGRPVRDVVEIPARCVCGNPLVAATAPRLGNGTPFPTTFYLTHPVITSAVSRLEANGVMNDMNELLAADRHWQRPTGAPTNRTWRPVTPSATVRHRRRPGDRRHLCRRHAHPRQMPPRPGGPLAGRRSRSQSAGRRSTGQIAEWWTADRCYCDGAWDTSGLAPSRDLSRHGPQGLPDIVGRPAPVRKTAQRRGKTA